MRSSFPVYDIAERLFIFIFCFLKTESEAKHECICTRVRACVRVCVCVCVRERERERLGKSGFKSTVSWTASKESSWSLVAKTALESPTFPITRSWPWKATFSHCSVVRSRFNLIYQKTVILGNLKKIQDKSRFSSWQYKSKQILRTETLWSARNPQEKSNQIKG